MFLTHVRSLSLFEFRRYLHEQLSNQLIRRPKAGSAKIPEMTNNDDFCPFQGRIYHISFTGASYYMFFGTGSPTRGLEMVNGEYLSSKMTNNVTPKG